MGFDRRDSLAAPHGGILLPDGANGARTGAGRRLPHPVQQLFQHDCMVVSFILGGKQEREALLVTRETVERPQVGFGIRTR